MTTRCQNGDPPICASHKTALIHPTGLMALTGYQMPTAIEDENDDLNRKNTEPISVPHDSGSSATLSEHSGALPEKHVAQDDSRPNLRTMGSSFIQVKKETRQSLKKYPLKGYKTTVKYFYQEVDSSWTAVMLVLCFFTSGLVDAVSFGVWGVFSAMQTGNTVFLAIRISSPPKTHHPLNYVKSLVSVISYCVGALLFNCLHRAPTGLSNPNAVLHRWTLTYSFLIQSALLVICAILAQLSVISVGTKECGTFSSGTPSNPGDHYLDLLGIALLAFESAGQVALSRALLVNELPTIVLSTLYHDLIGEALSTRKNWKESATKWDFLVSQKKQIRRLACIISLFSGALIGGFVFSSPGELAGALWLAAGIKTIICIAWCLWKRKNVTETITTTP